MYPVQLDSHGPILLALDVTPEGWNGFHVPICTAEELTRFLIAWRREDPNGEWDERPFADGETLRMPSWQDPADRDSDEVWRQVGRDDFGSPLYAIDGWAWTDADAHS